MLRFFIKESDWSWAGISRVIWRAGEEVQPKRLSLQLNWNMQGCWNSNKKNNSNYECSFHQEKLRTVCNSINHTQPLPAQMRMLLSWSWLNTTNCNVKLSLLVKTSENFTSGNAFKLPTPQEELQGKWQEYALGEGGKYLTKEHF